MKKLFKWIFSCTLVISMITISIPVTAANASYVALGDSITKGSGLSETEQNFATLLTQKKHLTPYVNYGINGFTISDLLHFIEDPQVQKNITNASFLTVTIGGNDVLDFVRNQAEKVSKKNYHSAEKVPSIIKEKKYAKLLDFYLRKPSVQKTIKAFDQTFENNFNALMKRLRQLNNHAVISLQTIYNPLTKSEYDAYAPYVDELLAPLNHYIITLNQPASKIFVTDTYQLFQSDNASYVRANERDIHPTAKGHQLIAKSILETLQNDNLKPLSTTTSAAAISTNTHGHSALLGSFLLIFGIICIVLIIFFKKKR